MDSTTLSQALMMLLTMPLAFTSFTSLSFSSTFTSLDFGLTHLFVMHLTLTFLSIWKWQSKAAVSGRTLATKFMRAVPLLVTITLGILSFEFKRPTDVSRTQVKLPSFSEARKAKAIEYVLLVEVTQTISSWFYKWSPW